MHPPIKTFRRDKLRRLIEAGRVVTVSTYSYDDMLGERRSREPMPVRIAKEGEPRPDGTVWLSPWCLQSGSGACYQREGSDIITLIVHSNSSYDLRVVDA